MASRDICEISKSHYSIASYVLLYIGAVPVATDTKIHRHEVVIDAVKALRQQRARARTVHMKIDADNV
jgi:hypothetical protein